MTRKLTDPADLATARDLRRSLTDGQSDLSADWLRATGVSVLAQESGRHLEPEDAEAVCRALMADGIDSVVAIANDALVLDEEAYAVDVTVEDLSQISDELGAINFVLADPEGTHCLLFTVDDFKLVAGPLEFVTAIVGDPREAKEDFRVFAADQLEVFRDVLDRAASYMDWVPAE